MQRSARAARVTSRVFDAPIAVNVRIVQFLDMPSPRIYSVNVVRLSLSLATNPAGTTEAPDPMITRVYKGRAPVGLVSVPLPPKIVGSYIHSCSSYHLPGAACIAPIRATNIFSTCICSSQTGWRTQLFQRHVFIGTLTLIFFRCASSAPGNTPTKRNLPAISMQIFSR